MYTFLYKLIIKTNVQNYERHLSLLIKYNIYLSFQLFVLIFKSLKSELSMHGPIEHQNISFFS